MSPAFGSPLEPVREGGAVTYISQVDAVETSNGVSPATVRVSWQIGDQNPALVEVYVKPASAGPTGIGTMVGRVAVGAGQPSDVSIQLPAPSWYAFLVAPRLLDAQGDPKDQMADAAGDDQYWENFVAEADLYVVGAPAGKPPGGPAVPQITGVTKSKGRFVVDWQIAKLPDHYNVRIDAPGDSRAQVEIPGGWTSYGVDLVEPARTYVFSIQACDRSVWGNATCSAWVSTEIPIDAAGGWETNDVPVDAGGHLAGPRRPIGRSISSSSINGRSSSRLWGPPNGVDGWPCPQWARPLLARRWPQSTSRRTTSSPCSMSATEAVSSCLGWRAPNLGRERSRSAPTGSPLREPTLASLSSRRIPS